MEIVLLLKHEFIYATQVADIEKVLSKTLGLPFEVIFLHFTACLSRLKQVSREHFLVEAEKKMELQQISDMEPESDIKNLLWYEQILPGI